VGLSFSARCRCVLQGGPKTGATMFDCPFLQTAWTNSRDYNKHTSTSYSFATGYRCCSELGRVVLNTCIPTELFTLEFACDVNVLGVKQIISTRVQCSSCCERGSTEIARRSYSWQEPTHIALSLAHSWLYRSIVTIMKS